VNNADAVWKIPRVKKLRDDNMTDQQKRIEEVIQKYFKPQEEVMKESKTEAFLRRKPNWKRGNSEFIRNK